MTCTADRFPVSVHAAVRFASVRVGFTIRWLRFVSVGFVRFDSNRTDNPNPESQSHHIVT